MGRKNLRRSSSSDAPGMSYSLSMSALLGWKSSGGSVIVLGFGRGCFGLSLPFSTICRLYIKGDFLPVFFAARQGLVRVSILLFRLDQLQSYAVGIKRDRLPSHNFKQSADNLGIGTYRIYTRPAIYDPAQ